MFNVARHARPHQFLTHRHHLSLFLLPIPFASGIIPKEILVHLGGFCLQASPGRGGSSESASGWLVRRYGLLSAIFSIVVNIDLGFAAFTACALGLFDGLQCLIQVRW